MKSSILGCGAAGSKVVFELIERGVVNKESCHIINSTYRDCPAEYRDIAIILCEDDRTGGCGKEREAGKLLASQYIEENNFDVSTLVDPEDDSVIIISAPEGGTGSGASVVFAQALNEILPVHIIMLNGFEDDARGIKNTVNYFKDLDASYTVEAISNKKFLRTTSSRIKAEAAANTEVVNRVMIYLANPIVESSQNIDATDHYKTITRPGFMDIELIELDKVKNVETFKKILHETVDNTKSIDFTPSASIVSVYINATDKTADLVTESFEDIKERFGNAFEIFHHVQYEGSKEWVAIIASGIKMPIEEVEAIYNKYLEESARVDKTKDNFFSSITTMNDLDEDESFNISDRRRRGGRPVQAAAPNKKSQGEEQNNKPVAKKGEFTATVRVVEGETTINNY